MELGELVDAKLPVQDEDASCPFSHESPSEHGKNELGGIGTTLGNNMAKGTGVHKSKPPTGDDFTKGTKEEDPRDRAGSERVISVFVKVAGKILALDGSPLPYPLTCAAHHLIPAQESLKGHALLKFMCKDGEQQDFRNSGGPAPSTVASKVWGNVAYNVNGCHNGVWLPGNYAVGGGKVGVGAWQSKGKRQKVSEEQAKNWVNALGPEGEEWVPATDEPWEPVPSTDPEEEEPPALQSALLASGSLPSLAGENYLIKDENPKWGYVKAAMDAVSGQFHDRHEDYSRFVQRYLGKIAESYEKMYDRSTTGDDKCEDCENAKRPPGAKKSLVGPPYGVVGRLVTASKFFKTYLAGASVTAKNVYTSKWVRQWIAKGRPTSST